MRCQYCLNTTADCKYYKRACVSSCQRVASVVTIMHCCLSPLLLTVHHREVLLQRRPRCCRSINSVPIHANLLQPRSYKCLQSTATCPRSMSIAYTVPLNQWSRLRFAPYTAALPAQEAHVAAPMVIPALVACSWETLLLAPAKVTQQQQQCGGTDRRYKRVACSSSVVESCECCQTVCRVECTEKSLLQHAD